MFLSIIIPAYNEEKRLPATLKKVRDYLNRQMYTRQGGGQAYEVYVVDDGSRDQTAGVVSKIIDGWPEFKLIGYQPNRGKGYAVKTGMLAAKGEWRLLMDADNSTEISEIEKLLIYACTRQHLQRYRPYDPPSGGSGPALSAKNPAEGGNHAFWPARATLEDAGSLQYYEVIIGSRYLKPDSIKIKQPLGRRVVSRLGNILVRILLGIKSADTQCGFKLFSARAVQEIFPKQTIDRWGFDMEILAIAIKKGYKIKEVPVDWADDEKSQRKLGIFQGESWKTLKELFAIKWNLIKGKY